MLLMRSVIRAATCACVIVLLSACGTAGPSVGPSAVENGVPPTGSSETPAVQLVQGLVEEASQADMPDWNSMSEVARISESVVIGTLESSESAVFHGIPSYVDGGKKVMDDHGHDCLEVLSRIRVERVLKGDVMVGDVITVTQVIELGSHLLDRRYPEQGHEPLLPNLGSSRLVLFLDEPFLYSDETGAHKDFCLSHAFQATWVVKNDGTVVESIDAECGMGPAPAYAREDSEPRARENVGLGEGGDPEDAKWVAEYAKNWPSTLDQLERMVAETPQSPR